MSKTETTTVHSLARELSQAFEGATRPNGDEYRRLRDGSPEWMSDVVREAHGTDADGAPAMLPDDYRYQYAENAADLIADNEDADLDDLAAEIEPDVYTHDLTEWLDSHLARQGYCDEWIEEMGSDGLDTFKLLAGGQYLERCEVFALVLAALGRRADA